MTLPESWADEQNALIHYRILHLYSFPHPRSRSVQFSTGRDVLRETGAAEVRSSSDLLSIVPSDTAVSRFKIAYKHIWRIDTCERHWTNAL